MFTIAHLSDLRFGAIHPAMAESLLRDVRNVAPDLVVVSGNLTRRGSADQFVAATRFLDTLECPKLLVPGPRDVYDLNPVMRILRPLRRWKACVSNDLTPSFSTPEVKVLGIDTARVKIGRRLSSAQAGAIRSTLGGDGPVTVLVSHHPLVARPDIGTTVIMRPELKELRVVSQCCDVILAGHQSIGSSQDTRVAYRVFDRQSIVAQAAITATAGRDGDPYYNAIRIDGDKVALAVRLWKGSAFEEQGSKSYRYTGSYWDKYVEMPPDFQWSDSSESAGR